MISQAAPGQARMVVLEGSTAARVFGSTALEGHLFTFAQAVEIYAEGFRAGRGEKSLMLGIGTDETVVRIAEYVERRARITAETIASIPAQRLQESP